MNAKIAKDAKCSFAKPPGLAAVRFLIQGKRSEIVVQKTTLRVLRGLRVNNSLSSFASSA